KSWPKNAALASSASRSCPTTRTRCSAPPTGRCGCGRCASDDPLTLTGAGMRPLTVVLALSCLFAATAFAAAPPANVPAEWLNLIDQLGEDNDAVRLSAEKKLTGLGEDALPVLRRAAKDHDDPDVRIQAGIVLRAIEKVVYVEVRSFVGHQEAVAGLAVSPD